jgi:type II secretory pathway pseudopilin PulG
MPGRIAAGRGRSKAPSRSVAFTLVELLVSIALLSFLLLALSAITEAASRAWREGQSRTDTFQSARTALDLMARELAPAVVDTRMQFVIAPASILQTVAKKNPDLAKTFVADSPALLWLAPIGDNGELCCVGYYLSRQPEMQFYRLKRLYISPPKDENERKLTFFPRLYNFATYNAKDVTLRPSEKDATWFTRNWDATAFDDEDPDNTRAVVSSAADGVIALWVQPLDLLGQPMTVLAKAPNHPKSTLFYNSAAFMQFATTIPFEDGRGVSFLGGSGGQTPLKANRVPAAIEVTIVTIDPATLARGVEVPEQTNEWNALGALDLEKSRAVFEEELRANGIHNARTFSTRARLNNGS